MTWQDGGSRGKPDVSGWRRPRMALAYSDNGEPRPLRWLWPGQIPKGALTLFDGQEGWSDPAMLELIARLTSGRDVAVAGDGYVTYVWVLTLEDDPETRVNPVLDAAGVKRFRVRVTEGIPRTNGLPVWNDQFEILSMQSIELPVDADHLEQALRGTEYWVLIIDSLRDYLADYLSPHSFHDVCSALGSLARLAWDLNLVVLLLGCDERLFPTPPDGWDMKVPHRRSVARVRWLSERQDSEYEHLLAASRPSWYERERLDVWLRNELAAGPVPVKELEWLAEEERGWTPKQLRAAKKRIGAAAHRQGFGVDGFSLWSLGWRRP